MQYNNDNYIDKMARDFNKKRREQSQLINNKHDQHNQRDQRDQRDQQYELSTDSVKPFNFNFPTLYSNIESKNSEFSPNSESDSMSSSISNISIPQQMKSDINSTHLKKIHNDDAIIDHIKSCRKCQKKIEQLYKKKLNTHKQPDLQQTDLIDYKQIIVMTLISIFVVLLIDLIKRK